MNDIVERLTLMWRSAEYDHETVGDAIDEIERLQRKCDYKDEVIEQRNAECSRQFKEIERLEAQVEALQNKCANRGLSPEDSDALQARNAKLEKVREAAKDLHDEVARDGIVFDDSVRNLGEALAAAEVDDEN